MTPGLKLFLSPCNIIYKEQQMIGGWGVYKKVLIIPTNSLQFSQAERTLIPKRPVNVQKVTISKNHSNYHTQNIFSVENIIWPILCLIALWL